VTGWRTLLNCTLTAALCFVISIAAAAPAASPQSFVEAIYRTYLGKAAKGIELTKESVIRRYFVPPLADAIVKDRAKPTSAAKSPRSMAIRSLMRRTSRSRSCGWARNPPVPMRRPRA
jgi:hypothetical protein